jgi:hypothetical protein
VFLSTKDYIINDSKGSEDGIEDTHEDILDTLRSFDLFIVCQPIFLGREFHELGGKQATSESSRTT